MYRALAIGLLCLAAFAAALALPSHRTVLGGVVSSLTPTATILFGGDMMFDRSIREYAAAKGDGYVFSCIDPTLASADLVVANLEGPITPNASQSVGTSPGSAGNFTFTFPTSTAALLSAHHIGIVNLGNNHIENFGTTGVRSTIEALREAGVAFFGDPINASVAHAQVKDIKLALINYNEFAPMGSPSSASTTIAQIAAAKAEGSVPIVYTHWGIEYQTDAPQYVVDLAHRFVDAGAAAVVGSHPHVVENKEIYKGAPIYYSLGNFIFDQYWDDAVTHGLLLELTVSQGGVVGTHEIPIVLSRDRRVCPQ